MTKLMKNPKCKSRVLDWLRATFNTNVEKNKFGPGSASASRDGFILNMASVMLLFCNPFTQNIGKYEDTIPKFTSLYFGS